MKRMLCALVLVACSGEDGTSSDGSPDGSENTGGSGDTGGATTSESAASAGGTSSVTTSTGGPTSGESVTTATTSAGTGGGTSTAECSEAGADCSASTCCEGSTCVTDGVVTVCAANCTSDDACRSLCCAPLEDGPSSVCSPPNFCNTAPTGTPVGTCPTLVVVGYDGQFLGIAESNPYGPDSVCNEFGSYGSEFATTSIYNEFGQYGSEFSTLSAYNSFTSTPPALLCDETGEILALVTKNTVLADGIDPDILCVVLAENGY
jgi:hypothetical protein